MAKRKASKRSKSTPAWFVWLRVIVLLLFIGGGFIGWRACYWADRQADSPLVTLVKVVDGDTIRVRDAHGEELKVRLIGIDTPELGTAASFRSALRAAELLESAKSIRLEPEPTKPRDKYGRILGWVFIEMADGRELLLQEEIVKSGLADLYRDAAGSKYYTRLEMARRYRPE